MTMMEIRTDALVPSQPDAGQADAGGASAGHASAGRASSVSERVSDLPAAALAAREFLVALGVSLDSEHLHDTPMRMAKAWDELLTARPFELTTFPNDGEYSEQLLVRDIPFQSVCEHHLLPFTGTAHVAYLPGERIVGLSKLARVVEMFAARPQTQERLTSQIARWLEEQLGARGVGVVMNADHSCMALRGVRAPGARTRTKVLLGDIRNDPGAREEFLADTAD